MAKYVINNEDGDLESLAKQVEQIRLRKEKRGDAEERVDGAVPFVDITPPEPAKTPTTVRRAVKKRSLVKPIVLSVSFSVVFVCCFFLIANHFRHAITGAQGIPNVVGQKVANAKAAITQAGFRAAVKYVQTKDYPVGTVIALVPAPGTKVKQGDQVVLKVAVHPTKEPTPPPPPDKDPPGKDPPRKDPSPPPSPPEKITIPAIDGMTARAMEVKLTELGLKVLKVTVKDAAKANGALVATEPKAGTQVERGASVLVQINAVEAPPLPPDKPVVTHTPPPPPPPRTLQLRNYVGVDGTAAVKELQSLGLKVDYTQSDEPTNYVQNTVISMNPKAGSRVTPGSAVVLVISK